MIIYITMHAESCPRCTMAVGIRASFGFTVEFCYHGGESIEVWKSLSFNTILVSACTYVV